MSGRSTAPRRSKASHVRAAAHVHKVRSTLRNVTAPKPPTAEPKVAIRLEMNAKRMEGSYGGKHSLARVRRIFSEPLKVELFSNETQRAPCSARVSRWPSALKATAHSGAVNMQIVQQHHVLSNALQIAIIIIFNSNYASGLTMALIHLHEVKH